jgi:hypothetical protein
MKATGPASKALVVDQLTVDRRVQRGLDTRRVDKIAEDFNRDAVGVLIVSHRDDGTYHVVDGQTRVAAMRKLNLGTEKVQCFVHEGLSLPQEAALFRYHNDSKKTQPITNFMMKVIEREPAAVEMSTILAKHGWQVTGATGRGCFAAVAALEWVYDGANLGKPGGGKACDDVIAVITNAFGHHPDGVRAELVRGLGLVVLRYGDDLDLRRLIVDLAKHDGGAIGVIGDARQLRKIRSCRIADAMAEVLVGMANKRRKTNRIPEWREPAS